MRFRSRPAGFLFRRLLIAFVVVAATACRLAPAYGDLLLASFPRDAARQALWQQVFRAVPAPLRPKRDVRVRAVSDNEMERLAREGLDEAAQEDDSVVDGMFFLDGDDRPNIALRRSLWGEKAALVFAHELGHLVWDTQLGRDQRGEYAEAYGRAKASKQLVTPYASESLEEGWAEAFSFFVLRPDTLRKRDPVSWAAFEKLCAHKNKSGVRL